MGEQTSTTRIDRARAAIIAIAAVALQTNGYDILRGFASQAGVEQGGGGWIYLPDMDRAAGQGWRTFAQLIAGETRTVHEAALERTLAAMAAHYESTMPADAPVPIPFDSGDLVTTSAGDLATVNAEQGSPGMVEVTILGSSNRQVYAPADLRLTPMDDEPNPVYAPHPTATVVFHGGTRFEVGDRVHCTGKPDDGTRWRIDRLYVPTDGREPFAGLTDPDDMKPGIRGTALRLGLLEHAPSIDARPTEPSALEAQIAGRELRGAPERTLADVFRDGEHLLERLRAEVEAAQSAAETDPATDDSVSDLVDRIVRRSQYLALREVLDVLGRWIEGIRENAEQLAGHELLGDAPTILHPGDVRRMVDDAARELGVPAPSKAIRK